MTEDVDRLISRGSITDALEKISQFNPHQQCMGKILKSRIYEVQGNYDAAHAEAVDALTMSLEEGRVLDELGARVALSYALLRQHRVDECSLALQSAKELIPTIPEEYYHQTRRYQATLLNICGLKNRIEGNLDEALEEYSRSLEIREKLGVLDEIGASKTNLGTIHHMMGDLERARQMHNDAMEIFKRLENDHLMAYALHSLGNVYWEMDNLEEAKNHFERALSIRLQLANPYTTSETLFGLILLNIEFDYMDQARFYFDMLSELVDEHYGDRIEIYYLLAEAMILQTSSRLLHRAQAQEILEELLKRPLWSDLMGLVYLTLCDLYLTELKVSKNEDVIKDVERLISELQQLAKQQHSSILRIETLLVRAKLFLVKLDLETAQQILFQAELMANKKGLHNLEFKVSAEHDNLIDKLFQWDQLKSRNASLVERLREADFLELIDQLKTKRGSTTSRGKVEEPYFLLVMNTDSLPLYSVKFNEAANINQELIGSFLMASNIGMAVAFEQTGSIERIKYGKYTLVFMHHDRLVFCYGFEGQSYYAIQRLRDFVDRIRLGRVWDLLRADVPRPKAIEQDLTERVVEYFGKDSVYSTIGNT
ncbi:MAG: tetratricopeptide repeat protein [Candidatus Kariarchaeaceae archaeon]|jgi:tetratricopeptide (TPR) repeat protein